jgi:UDP-2,4-diacetamido-2,4,6-trideoxy-beta-L-altropyranose hydrolase
MRCLTLADALESRGATTHFVCRAHNGNLIDWLRARGMRVSALPAPASSTADAADEDYAAWMGVSEQVDADETIHALSGSRPDWLVVDNYALGREWERRLRPHVGKLMVIDDLPAREHDCDLFLDQNETDRSEATYRARVPVTCQLALGPRYAVLRSDYLAFREKLAQRDGQVRRVLVFFGGSDPYDLTGVALDALTHPDLASVQVDLVVGANYAHRAALEQKVAQRPRTQLFGPRPHLADLFAAADLAIGAGGSTTWERMCLGVPTLIVSIAENQRRSSELLAAKGMVSYLGTADRVDAAVLRAAVLDHVQSPARLREMSEKGQVVVDGFGAGRLCECMDPTPAEALTLRPARDADLLTFFSWANDPEVRRQSLSPDAIPLEGHRKWFLAKLASRQSHLFVLMAGALPVGQIRFDIEGADARIDYSVDRLFRGRGWGQRIVLMGMQALSSSVKATFLAEVKVENPASAAVFSKLGFTESAQPHKGLRTFRLGGH